MNLPVCGNYIFVLLK